jgi:preprotein translocase subunit SecY
MAIKKATQVKAPKKAGIKKMRSAKATSKKSTIGFVKSNNFFVRNKDLFKRIFFTLLVLALIRLMTFITVPGVQLSSNFAQEAGNSEFFQLLSTLGGGGIGKFSIIALGVSPYITASIIVQLLSTDVIPVLSRWTKSGERGRRKLDRLTKVLSIPFALMQSVATIFTLQGVISPKWSSDVAGTGPAWFYYVLVPTIMLGGTFLMLWISDQITIRGIGNGVSLIIFTGIVANMPQNIISTYKFYVTGNEEASVLYDGVLKFVIYLAAFVFVIFFIVLTNEAERKVPIQQVGSGLASIKEHKPFLPLKLNNAGVIPVIFASAIISTPMTVAQIIGAKDASNGFVLWTQSYLSYSTWWGIAIYAVLTLAFTFLYAQVQLNPEKISENFQKSGTFIPGIKPGKDTERYLRGVINRLSIFGSVILTAIAVLPYIISKLTSLPSSLAIGGTGIIICVSVAIQTVQQLKGRIIQQSFIDKKTEKFEESEATETSSHIW